MIPYLERIVIQKHAAEARDMYVKITGRPLSFPLPLEDMFYTLFDLETIYDTEGCLNKIEPGLLGCLFPDGQPSPFMGKDKIIAVNQTPIAGFDPTRYGAQHTIAHEGMGHYILHFLKGTTGKKNDRPAFCRNGTKDPLEWQADFAAGEFMQPEKEVTWILDGKKAPECINVDVYEKAYREFFGTTRSGMEMRLKVLGYQMVNARNSWAGSVGKSSSKPT